MKRIIKKELEIPLINKASGEGDWIEKGSSWDVVAFPKIIKIESR